MTSPFASIASMSIPLPIGPDPPVQLRYAALIEQILHRPVDRVGQRPAPDGDPESRPGVRHPADVGNGHPHRRRDQKVHNSLPEKPPALDFKDLRRAGEGRTNYAREISALLRDTYGSKIRVFATDIPHSVRAAEISAEGKSIFAHDPKGKVAEAYRALTKEVMRIEKQREKHQADLSR